MLHCQQVTNSQLIIGEWKFDNQPKHQFEPPSANHGYNFLPNGTCEYKPVFLEKGKDNHTPQTFLGTSTPYKLTGNQLQIYHLSQHRWKKATIEFHSNDTLLLKYGDGSIGHYYRMNYPYRKADLFDDIIVSASGCFGSCPIDNTYLKKDGTVLYYNETSSPFSLYQLKLDTTTLSKIYLQFVKADIEGMQTIYKKSITDYETITVTFLKNGKIVKTILDYAYTAPDEFNWAYTPIRYLYQQIPKTPITSIPDYLKIQHLNFESTQERTNLRKSESFYLWNLLFSGKEVDQLFDSSYTLDYHSRDTIQQTIKTDGRFYRFEMKNGKIITIDIGFNFIAENSLKLTMKKDK